MRALLLLCLFALLFLFSGLRICGIWLCIWLSLPLVLLLFLALCILGGWDESLLPLVLPLLPVFCLPCQLGGLFGLLLLPRLEKVLSTLELEIDLARLLWWREGGIRLGLDLVLLHLGLASCRTGASGRRHISRSGGGGGSGFGLDVAFLKLGQEAFPVLLGKFGVFGQLALDHELLDVVDGMDVFQTINYDPPDLFEAFERAHSRDCVALYQHVAACQEFDRLECATIRTDDPLPSLDKALLISQQVADLDHVALDAILEDLDGLREGHGSREKSDHVSRFENHIRVVRLPGGLDGHGAFDKIQRACDAMLVERRGDVAPYFLEVALAVLGEERGKRRLFEERAFDLVWRKLGHLPVVDGLVVPGFVLAVLFVFGDQLRWLLSSVGHDGELGRGGSVRRVKREQREQR